MKNSTMGHKHRSSVEAQTCICRNQQPVWQLVITGTRLRNCSAETPTSSSTVLNKAQHCSFSGMTVSAVPQVLTQSHRCSALKKGRVTRNPCLCLTVLLSDSDGWAGDKGWAVVPFSWHLAACFGLGFTTVVAAAPRTEGDSKPTLQSLLQRSLAAVMRSREHEKDQGPKKGKRDTEWHL